MAGGGYYSGGTVVAVGDPKFRLISARHQKAREHYLNDGTIIYDGTIAVRLVNVSPTLSVTVDNVEPRGDALPHQSIVVGFLLSDKEYDVRSRVWMAADGRTHPFRP